MSPEIPSSPESAAVPPLPFDAGAARDLRQGVILSAVPSSLFRAILSDNSGNVSSLRAVFVAATLIIVIAWAAISIRVNALQPLPESVVAVLGVIFGSKLWQKGQETDASNPSSRV